MKEKDYWKVRAYCFCSMVVGLITLLSVIFFTPEGKSAYEVYGWFRYVIAGILFNTIIAWLVAAVNQKIYYGK